MASSPSYRLTLRQSPKRKRTASAMSDPFRDPSRSTSPTAPPSPPRDSHQVDAESRDTRDAQCHAANRYAAQRSDQRPRPEANSQSGEAMPHFVVVSENSNLDDVPLSPRSIPVKISAKPGNQSHHYSLRLTSSPEAAHSNMPSIATGELEREHLATSLSHALPIRPPPTFLLPNDVVLAHRPYHHAADEQYFNLTPFDPSRGRRLLAFSHWEDDLKDWTAVGHRAHYSWIRDRRSELPLEERLELRSRIASSAFKNGRKADIRRMVREEEKRKAESGEDGDEENDAESGAERDEESDEESDAESDTEVRDSMVEEIDSS